ncbi:MAG TPA: ATP-binding protein [Gemmatimonadaceae bacterium]|nr:ATP-binding protein [Gemmatimonadaceae bacterium]
MPHARAATRSALHRHAGAAEHLWTVLGSGVVLAAAYWLSTLSERYLALAIAATVLALLAALRGSDRGWALLAVAFAAIFCLTAVRSAQHVRAIASAWPAHRDAEVATAVRRASTALDGAIAELSALAERSLSAPTRPADAFEHLARLGGMTESRGVVLYRAREPVAWAGTTYVASDTLTRASGVVFDRYYVTLYAVARRGSARAVATEVVAAEPPGDSIVSTLAARVARHAGLDALRFMPTGSVPPAGGAALYRHDGHQLFTIVAIPRSRGEAELGARSDARITGATLLAATFVLVLIAVWRREEGLAWRLVPVAAGLVALARVPLSAFSSTHPIFDPSAYYTGFGGAFTASAGALALAGTLLALGALLVLRSGWRIRPAWLGDIAAAALVAASPFVMGELTRGVTVPPSGVTATLWLTWETAFFLAAGVMLLLVLIARGRSRRGIAPGIAPVLAALAAVISARAVEIPERWPVWYVAIWVGVAAAVALSRGHRRRVLSAGVVAALAAATLTWSAVMRGRMGLALADVAGLARVEPDVGAALARFAEQTLARPAPATEAELLQRYVRSDLAGADLPVRLATWSPGDSVPVTLALSTFSTPAGEVRMMVERARGTGETQSGTLLGAFGVVAAVAIPFPSGAVTTALVAPRTRLIADAPFNALLGLPSRERGEPPYSLSLVSRAPGTVGPAASDTTWQRRGDELHGDRAVQTARGPQRAHIEIDLRSPDVLVERGTLVVLLDLLLLLALWLASTLPQGGIVRWTRARLRRWRRSYRARLTLALFGFFVLPALAFAAWSYGRLRTEDRQSRELLVREALRSVTVAGGGALGDEGTDDELAGATASRAPAREDATPLFLYHNGALVRTSTPLYAELVPIGRFVPPTVALSLGETRELYTSRIVPVGERSALVGYRALPSTDGEPRVVAAPARGNEELLDQRRRDLGVLVLFATVLGGMAALWLSGIAARSLAEPIGRLRSAALAIAAGEREPPLAGEPPAEFAPVFSAFRRMASDLGESRAALEAAQRRTAAVLRNVASGVVALDPEGRVTIANPSAETLLGQPLERGTALDRLPGAGRTLAARVRAFVQGGRGGGGRADDEDFELHLASRQLQARLTRVGDGSATVLTLDDVTALARAQRVLAWGEMARQVAHEIKNPLTPIRLGVQHLRRVRAASPADFDRVLDQNVDQILREIDRLDQIARAFSRYGMAPADRAPGEPTDIHAVVRDVVELERLGAGSVRWTVADGTGPVWALARPEELREVLLNILENARLADARAVDVAVRTAGARVEVEVRDDGRGIPPAVMPRIFEPHFSTRTSGSGLGLAVSRQLVEGWGGTIDIHSVPGEGTTVRVALVTASGAAPGARGASRQADRHG